MRRFAAHYIYLPDWGFLQKHVIEMHGGRVTRLFPLTEEVEDTEWLSGVIALVLEGKQAGNSLFGTSALLADIPSEFLVSLSVRIPYRFYPFDFTGMKPVVETQHRQLR